jgi:hypothetical protein
MPLHEPQRMQLDPGGNTDNSSSSSSRNVGSMQGCWVLVSNSGLLDYVSRQAGCYRVFSTVNIVEQ